METAGAMRLLDAFCGQGGSAMGYHRAGFTEIVGVDNKPQPRYPFTFILGDALEYIAAHGHEFDAIHASPPCQDHSPLKSRAGEHGTGWMLPATLELLPKVTEMFVVENVMGARMPRDLVLCGSMFGLRVYRHRKFHIGGVQMLTALSHPRHIVKTSTKKRKRDWDAGMNISVTGDIGTSIGGPAMGIDWMTGDGLSQAIPPAYTEFIGSLLADQLRRAA
jgi:DNA (cytosine-5)-methyltransferase 1